MRKTEEAASDSLLTPFVGPTSAHQTSAGYTGEELGGAGLKHKRHFGRLAPCAERKALSHRRLINRSELHAIRWLLLWGAAIDDVALSLPRLYMSSRSRPSSIHYHLPHSSGAFFFQGNMAVKRKSLENLQSADQRCCPRTSYHLHFEASGHDFSCLTASAKCARKILAAGMERSRGDPTWVAQLSQTAG